MSPNSERAKHGTRGAVLVETALVVGVILTMLLFSIQVGVLGFLQITVDAASFVDAHLVSVGVAASMSPQQATSNIFPQIAPSLIASTVAPAPSPSVPVDYGYNSTDAAEQSASATHRNGGASMIEPTLETATVTKPNIFSMFGKSVGVRSQSVEAVWLECGIHANVSNSASGCSPGAASTFQGNYFSAGEHAPPYFIGFDYLHHCNNPQPWTSCTNAGVNFLALGTSEFLHAAAGEQVGNWANPLPGAGGLAGTSTFSLMACHQRVYALIAGYFSLFPTLKEYYDTPSINPAGAGQTNAAVVFYSLWGTTSALYPSYTTTRSGMNDFGLGPPIAQNVTGTVQNFDVPTDQNIDTVYGWDNKVAPGTAPGGALSVGTIPTTPQTNCL